MIEHVCKERSEKHKNRRFEHGFEGRSESRAKTEALIGRMLLTLLLSSSLVTIAWSCSCIPLDTNQNLCSSDFVGVVRVVDECPVLANEDSGSKNRYTVNVVDRWRGGKAGTRQITSIESNKDSAACGVLLQVGKEYLVTGQLVQDGRLSVNLCGSIVRETKNITDKERNQLRKVASRCPKACS